MKPKHMSRLDDILAVKRTEIERLLPRRGELRAAALRRDDFRSFHHALLPTDPEREQIQSLATDLPTLWHAPETTAVDRKSIIRLLIDKIQMMMIDKCQMMLLIDNCQMKIANLPIVPNLRIEAGFSRRRSGKPGNRRRKARSGRRPRAGIFLQPSTC